MSIPGIDYKFSIRIFQYIRSVGGIADMNELLTVEGMTQDILTELCKVYKAVIVYGKININVAKKGKVIQKLGLEAAEIIINYRDQIGEIWDWNELMDNPLIAAAETQKKINDFFYIPDINVKISFDGIITLSRQIKFGRIREKTEFPFHVYVGNRKNYTLSVTAEHRNIWWDGKNLVVDVLDENGIYEGILTVNIIHSGKGLFMIPLHYSFESDAEKYTETESRFIGALAGTIGLYTVWTLIKICMKAGTVLPGFNRKTLDAIDEIIEQKETRKFIQDKDIMSRPSDYDSVCSPPAGMSVNETSYIQYKGKMFPQAVRCDLKEVFKAMGKSSERTAWKLQDGKFIEIVEDPLWNYWQVEYNICGDGWVDEMWKVAAAVEKNKLETWKTFGKAYGEWKYYPGFQGPLEQISPELWSNFLKSYVEKEFATSAVSFQGERFIIYRTPAWIKVADKLKELCPQFSYRITEAPGGVKRLSINQKEPPSKIMSWAFSSLYLDGNETVTFEDMPVEDFANEAEFFASEYVPDLEADESLMYMLKDSIKWIKNDTVKSESMCHVIRSDGAFGFTSEILPCRLLDPVSR